VLAEVGAPAVTVPPTDEAGAETAGMASNTWRLVLLMLAGSIATLLILTPARRRA
jgi:hypothetical protein